MAAKRFLRALVFLAAVLLMALRAESIGILSSGDMSVIHFQPNSKITLPFGVDSNMEIPMDVEVSVGGDLAKYARLSEKIIFLNPGETKYFTVTVDFPAYIDVPGDHILWITAAEQPRGGAISVRGIVSTYVRIKVPYAGKYSEISFDASDANAGEMVKFTVAINNLGKEDIKKAKAKIGIFGPGEGNFNSYMGAVYTEEKHIPSKSSDSLMAYLNTTGYNPGEYKALATIFYDENQTAREKNFRIGYLHVKIINYTSEFKLNKIQRFDVEVESAWNNAIENIYVGIAIIENNSLIADLKTPSLSLNPWKRETASAYWDTMGLAAKEYDATITAYYANKTTAERVRLNIMPERPPLFSITTIALIAIIMLLVIGNVVLVVRRRISREQPKKAKKKKF